MPSAPHQDELDERSLDFVIAVQLAGLALGDESLRRLRARGHPGLRFGHGFVFQHLLGDPIAIGELARRLGVSQQAASKTVDELVRIGYVERVTAATDRRVRLIALTERGRAAVEDARSIRAELAAELARELGEDRLTAAREAVLGALGAVGGLAAVRRRRVPPPG